MYFGSVSYTIGASSFVDYQLRGTIEECNEDVQARVEFVQSVGGTVSQAGVISEAFFLLDKNHVVNLARQNIGFFYTFGRNLIWTSESPRKTWSHDE